MKRIGAALNIVVGLVLVVALVGAIGWFVYTAIDRAPAVVAAVVTGVGALLGLAVQRFLEHQREDERDRRARMAPIYEQLVRTFYGAARGGGVRESDLEAFFNELAQSLLIWGSEPVIVAFDRWRAVASIAGDSASSLFAFEDLLYAIRADLGNEHKNMGRGDLLRVVINDIEDYLPESTSPAS